MTNRSCLALIVCLWVTIGSMQCLALDLTSKRFLLDKEGGAIEVRASHPDDIQTRDAVRQELQREARKGVPFTTPAMQEHKKEIKYRYEKTARGARIRIIARSRAAFSAVQDFLRSQMTNSGGLGVAFDFAQNTALVVLPVTINEHGPYKFLLDTGASNTVLSATVADNLALPSRRIGMALTAGGDLPVTVRPIKRFEVGAAVLEDVEIAVTNFELMKTLNIDGILGADFLRRFKISIDYDNKIVDIEPFSPEAMSMFVA